MLTLRATDLVLPGRLAVIVCCEQLVEVRRGARKHGPVGVDLRGANLREEEQRKLVSLFGFSDYSNRAIKLLFLRAEKKREQGDLNHEVCIQPENFTHENITHSTLLKGGKMGFIKQLMNTKDN